jgi:hypothetical protein
VLNAGSHKSIEAPIRTVSNPSGFPFVSITSKIFKHAEIKIVGDKIRNKRKEIMNTPMSG